MDRNSLGRFAVGLLAFGGLLAAHYTWIAPPAQLAQGKECKILIGHGHQFPVSEEAIAAAQVKAFAVAPSGRRTELKATKAGKAVEVTYTPQEPGTHVLGFVQDRGVTSRTPAGVKPGGRDVNPDARQALRTVRTATAYASTSKAAVAGKPLQLELEIVPEVTSASIVFQVLRKGQPLAGVPIQMLAGGQGQPRELGRTGAQGKLTFVIAAGSRPPALFLASLTEPAPKGASYDTTDLSTSLLLSW